MIGNRARVFARTKGMPREEWLALRRRGIGGSDAAALMGANPYVSPLAVYADKIGAAPDRETNEAMRQGNDFEQYVADRFTEDTGIKLHRANVILQHPEYPWMLANIDRDAVGEAGGFEAKTTNMLNKHDFANGEVPLNYQWQCQHYMAVTGAPRWYLGVLVLGKAFYTFEIPRDETLISALIEAEKTFWLENVEKRVPPLPVGCAADEDALNALYPESGGADSIDLYGVRDQLELLELLEADKALLEAKITAARDRIKLAMGNRELGAVEAWRVSWKNSARTTLDAKRLKEDMPEVYAQYARNTSARTFRITKKKEEEREWNSRES